MGFIKVNRLGSNNSDAEQAGLGAALQTFGKGFSDWAENKYNKEMAEYDNVRKSLAETTAKELTNKTSILQKEQDLQNEQNTLRMRAMLGNLKENLGASIFETYIEGATPEEKGSDQVSYDPGEKPRARVVQKNADGSETIIDQGSDGRPEIQAKEAIPYKPAFAGNKKYRLKLLGDQGDLSMQTTANAAAPYQGASAPTDLTVGRKFGNIVNFDKNGTTENADKTGKSLIMPTIDFSEDEYKALLSDPTDKQSSLDFYDTQANGAKVLKGVMQRKLRDVGLSEEILNDVMGSETLNTANFLTALNTGKNDEARKTAQKNDFEAKGSGTRITDTGDVEIKTYLGKNTIEYSKKLEAEAQTNVDNTAKMRGNTVGIGERKQKESVANLSGGKSGDSDANKAIATATQFATERLKDLTNNKTNIIELALQSGQTIQIDFTNNARADQVNKIELPSSFTTSNEKNGGIPYIKDKDFKYIPGKTTYSQLFNALSEEYQQGAKVTFDENDKKDSNRADAKRKIIDSAIEIQTFLNKFSNKSDDDSSGNSGSSVNLQVTGEGVTKAGGKAEEVQEKGLERINLLKEIQDLNKVEDLKIANKRTIQELIALKQKGFNDASKKVKLTTIGTDGRESSEFISPKEIDDKIGLLNGSKVKLNDKVVDANSEEVKAERERLANQAKEKAKAKAAAQAVTAAQAKAAAKAKAAANKNKPKPKAIKKA